MGDCKITNVFWLPDGSLLQVRFGPVENLSTVVVIPIPTRTAEISDLFVTLTIAGRNMATPTLDTTDNQRLVDLLAYMKINFWDLHWGVTYQPIARNLQSLRLGTQTIDDEGK